MGCVCVCVCVCVVVVIVVEIKLFVQLYNGHSAMAIGYLVPSLTYEQVHGVQHYENSVLCS